MIGNLLTKVLYLSVQLIYAKTPIIQFSSPTIVQTGSANFGAANTKRGMALTVGGGTSTITTPAGYQLTFVGYTPTAEGALYEIQSTVQARSIILRYEDENKSTSYAQALGILNQDHPKAVLEALLESLQIPYPDSGNANTPTTVLQLLALGISPDQVSARLQLPPQLAQLLTNPINTELLHPSLSIPPKTARRTDNNPTANPVSGGGIILARNPIKHLGQDDPYILLGNRDDGAGWEIAFVGGYETGKDDVHEGIKVITGSDKKKRAASREVMEEMGEPNPRTPISLDGLGSNVFTNSHGTFIYVIYLNMSKAQLLSILERRRKQIRLEHTEFAMIPLNIYDTAVNSGQTSVLYQGRIFNLKRGAQSSSSVNGLQKITNRAEITGAFR